MARPRDRSGAQPSPRLPAALLVFVPAALAWSGIRPCDRATGWMEVAPVFVVVPLLWASCRRFPLTRMLCRLIARHALVLIVGGACTCARVPLGFQFAEFFGLTRNPCDKLGHFFQGFVPALAAREVLRRGRVVRGRRMLAFVVVCIVLAISAGHELIEWGAALALGQGADEFLGIQGDSDTQSDMGFALLGAITALLLLSRLHDRQMKQLAAGRADPRT